jgi:hypothetical protein
VAIPALATLAQGTPPTDLMSWLTGSAVTVLAAVIFALMRRWLVTGAELQRIQTKLDAAEERERERSKDDRLVLIPLLTRTTDTLARHLERRLGDTPQPPNKGA